MLLAFDGERSSYEAIMASDRLSNESGDHDRIPSEITQAKRFEQARAARATAIHEDYVELIDDLIRTSGVARPTDIARRLGVSHPTVVNTIGRLKREGLAEARPYRGVFLTPKGKAMAAMARDRHTLVFNILLALGVPPEAAASDAEGIEHHVSDATLRAFSKFLQTEDKQS